VVRRISALNGIEGASSAQGRAADRQLRPETRRAPNIRLTRHNAPGKLVASHPAGKESTMRRSAFRSEAAGRGLLTRATLALLLTSSPALAVDGVIEINQAAALAGGITSCDTPGFPVNICASGSYRLTSDLAYTSGPAIDIAANDVTLDLNGMTVSGPHTCTTGGNQWVTGCTGSGLSNGVQSGAARARVRNGTVRGAGGDCVSLSGGAPVIENVVATDCRGSGVLLSSRATASGIRAIGNLLHGISAADQSQLRDVLATNNGGNGIFIQSGSEIQGAVAALNGGHGIELRFGSSLSNFSSTSNQGNGVRLGDGSLARAGSIRNSGVGGVGSCGLQGQGGAGYREIVITAESGDEPTTACGAGLVNLGDNTCQGGSCP